MTRFKELRRIESAIEHKNESELQWAADYCKMRLRIATKKEHQKYWRSIEKKVSAVLADAESPKRSE